MTQPIDENRFNRRKAVAKAIAMRDADREQAAVWLGLAVLLAAATLAPLAIMAARFV